MSHRYLVVSDLHLADIEDHADGWMAHKSSCYIFDDTFAELVREFLERAAAADQLTLILNGDIVDFDLVTAIPEQPPWPVSRFERARGLSSTAQKSAWKLERVLSHHPRFVEVVAEFLGLGHRVVYVLGNHDRELHYPEVQQVLSAAIAARAKATETGPAPTAIRFEPWFFYVPGEIYAEHGNQYDDYGSFRFLLWPVVSMGGEQVLALPMGNLTNRCLMSRMGYFNPHASDFILNLFSYALHWLRFYAFTRRSLVWQWFWGSVVVVARLLETKRKLRTAPPQHQERMDQVAKEGPLCSDEVQALAALQHKPITSRMFRLLRELWIDRVVIAVLMTAGTVALALSPIPLWIKLMVPLSSFPLTYFIYERLAEGETIFTIEKEIPMRAGLIARMLAARVVTFGHTHKPRQIPLSRESTFVDTGTWAPVMDPRNRGDLVPGLRNFLEAEFQDGDTRVVLGSWMPARPAPPRA